MILLKNIALFLLAVLLLCTVGVFGFLYTIGYGVYSFLEGLVYKEINSPFPYFGKLLFSINVGIDKIGNVLLGEFLNQWAVKERRYPFGKKEDTISYALAINALTYEHNNLNKLGKFLYNSIETLDKGHFEKIIEKRQ